MKTTITTMIILAAIWAGISAAPMPSVPDRGQILNAEIDSVTQTNRGE